MASRGHRLLRLASSDAGRDDGWRALIADRDLAKTQALARDFLKRGFLTTDDPTTMQVTEMGRVRLRAGELLERDPA